MLYLGMSLSPKLRFLQHKAQIRLQEQSIASAAKARAVRPWSAVAMLPPSPCGAMLRESEKRGFSEEWRKHGLRTPRSALFHF